MLPLRTEEGLRSISDVQRPRVAGGGGEGRVIPWPEGVDNGEGMTGQDLATPTGMSSGGRHDFQGIRRARVGCAHV